MIVIGSIHLAYVHTCVRVDECRGQKGARRPFAMAVVAMEHYPGSSTGRCKPSS